MACRLILNADDFGLTRGINRAVAELHESGVLTSATLMANGPAFDDAVALAKGFPLLGVGCHIVLVDGAPVSPPEKVLTLLGPDRRTFRRSLLHFVRDLYLGRIKLTEIARETSAQIAKLQAAGIAITHVDTHKHTHMFTPVARALLSTGLLPAIRNPFEPIYATRLSHAPALRRLQLALLRRYEPSFARLMRYTRTTNGTLGVAATGTLSEPTLSRLLRRLPNEGTYELCCHPGYRDADLDRTHTRLRATREIEHQALLTVIAKILSLPHPPQLIHYGNL